MTRLIKYSEVCIMGDYATYFTKGKFNGDDLIVAQIDKDEYWFDVHSCIDSEQSSAIKNGYTMYILSKHNK